MKEHSTAIKIVRNTLDLYRFASAFNISDSDDIKRTQDALESILGIDRQAEFQEMLKILAGDKPEQQAQPEKKVDPDSAILNFYERQMAEPELKPIRRSKRGGKP